MIITTRINTINKYFFIILILIITLPVFVKAEVTSISNSGGLSQVDITGVFMQEEIKTRADFKAYTDKKINDMITILETKGQDFINQNFAVFDKRMHDLAQLWVIRITITVFTSVLLAQLTFYFIRRKIEKRQRPRIDTIRTEGIKPVGAGIIDPQYMKDMTATHNLPISPEMAQNLDKQFPLLNMPLPPRPPTKHEMKVVKRQMEEQQKNKAKSLKKLAEDHQKTEKYLEEQKKIYEKKRAEEEEMARNIAKYEESKKNIVRHIEEIMGNAHEINHEPPKQNNEPTNPVPPTPIKRSQPPTPPPYDLKELEPKE